MGPGEAKKSGAGFSSLVGSLSVRHKGKHALVTGAGTGIGRAIALRLAAEGASVSLLARDESRLEETVAEARALGASGLLHTDSCDIRDLDSVRGCLRSAADALGPFDFVIANAGIGGSNGPGFQSDEEPDRFHDLVATNLSGTYHTFRAAIPHLRSPKDADADEDEDDGPRFAGDRRHLVAVASILARIGVVGYTGYCASKAGIGGLVRALSAELAPDEVQVNAIAPGWVDTAMARQGIEGMAKGLGLTFDEAHALAMKDVPLGRMGQPEDVAGLVAWLVSRDAHGVTGQTIDMNGGAFML
ncbi:3-oxoacyl-[acyl-carrier-protein] reductase FabG [Planctomycetes bacterium Poly30]|uniref:3-oxoacyl-[acyl-carrier-protein] reductase FabG n=1 Tax=Saltatorellus ferox TaxID=2528018 RepID=A0A518EWP5_9BACT|nr:3-oxoacyl-[acyl-carrier-protein] reductase FabG [Planctomycetes bacterium Poly30]